MPPPEEQPHREIVAFVERAGKDAAVFRHLKMTGAELHKALADLDMSDEEFMWLTGVGRKNLAPNWVRILVEALADREARERAQETTSKVWRSEDTYRKHRDGRAPHVER